MGRWGGIHYRKILWLLPVFLAAAVFLYLRFGCSLVTLEVTGCTYYENQELRSWLSEGGLEDQSWFLYLKLKFGDAPVIPFIEHIEVDFVDMHTLRLQVYEKEIIGCIPYMGEFVCFDKDGIMVGSVTERREDIPEVTGISYERIVYNEKMDTPRDELFQLVLNVTQLIRQYELSIRRIDFNYGMEITMYTGSVRILLGRREQYDEPLSALSGILKEAEGMKGTFHMEEYSRKNDKVVFVTEED
ncbi:MAG: hypothetical protein HFI40_09825 [Lachnospiraceae bacterium]|jgi:cell division protein FtsQ|nr:hypothetical protein [Lachnospiraceae bacterium]